MNTWRTGAVDIGDMRILDGEFEQRLSHSCWARGRLKKGDIVVAVSHSGDCFHHYLLLQHAAGTSDGKPTLFLTPVPAPFGAYTMGSHLGSLDKAQLGTLMAGQSIQIDLPERLEELHA
ncbi:hypothetical protein QH494_03840 [Sphingomonas sp. AR_OL41]|uniref:hypothetical protein n=1 Tax=Sphingomonas sp. AR_OL41 TaxID=3042729 RepID=UPI002480997D|nr:hypothetical protein [Sphingomonas sp. AR_OL41]MDH7971302.1 hypothetical protein [Sphingomonas sp. AR_OL41]